MKYAIGGAAFSGNKGAEGMLLSLIRHIGKIDENAEFSVLSYYPVPDRIAGHETGNIRILDGSPKSVIKYFFQSFWCLFCRALHLPRAFWRHGDFARISECDLFLDAAGISFSDGREKFTVFNILTFLPALASGVRVVKVSQAMGPFRHFLNRMLAKLFLPRLACIAARGKQTLAFLAELKLKNLCSYPDSAFSLECTENDFNEAEKLLPEEKMDQVIIGISPSQVVYSLCSKSHTDYLGILKEIVSDCRTKGYLCVLFPHSARTGTEKRHNNDLPLLKEFSIMLDRNDPGVIVIDRELEAGVLRCLIGKMDLLIASRFHAIISSMAMGVPAAVIGWSHKYEEVLAPFKLDSFVQSYADFSFPETEKIISRLLAERKELSEAIRKETSVIRKANEDFFRKVFALASEK